MELDWETRVERLWDSFDDLDEVTFRDRIEALADDPAAPAGAATFERACAFDSTGHPDRAVPLYRDALASGVAGIRRRRAIQLPSSLRNLGEAGEAVALLEAERERDSDALDDAVDAFLALTLADSGREREAAAIALEALAPHLPRYQRSLANYARDLND